MAAPTEKILPDKDGCIRSAIQLYFFPYYSRLPGLVLCESDAINGECLLTFGKWKVPQAEGLGHSYYPVEGLRSQVRTPKTGHRAKNLR